jgi:hypothetical protein
VFLVAICVLGCYLCSRLLFRTLNIKIYRTIILHVVLYECETWSLTLREEHRLRVFEDSVEGNIWAQGGQGNRGLEKTS